jgi:hypothetical protein
MIPSQSAHRSPGRRGRFADSAALYWSRAVELFDPTDIDLDGVTTAMRQDLAEQARQVNEIRPLRNRPRISSRLYAVLGSGTAR